MANLKIEPMRVRGACSVGGCRNLATKEVYVGMRVNGGTTFFCDDCLKAIYEEMKPKKAPKQKAKDEDSEKEEK